MKRRKRRRTMRPPQNSQSDAADNVSQKLRNSPNRLCINGICTVHHHAEEASPPPSLFSDSDRADNLQCSSDGLNITYKGPGREEKDAASIRADLPVPVSGIALYYFEITIVDEGDNRRIGVGLCEKSAKLEKMPGWEPGSYAYHGDDGLLFRQTGSAGTPYGPKYGSGDVIGCGWDLVENVVFFTKNTKNLGTAFIDVRGTLYPTVGMQAQSGRIVANFGSQPFTYDVESYAQQMRQSVRSTVLQVSFPQDYRILSDTVLSYLMHNGYSSTAAAFAKDSGREHIFTAEQQSMRKRQLVCDKVLEGDIDGAICDVRKQFPQVLENQLEVRFLLHTQKFIEMIVNGALPEDAVEYGRKELSVFRSQEYISTAESMENGTVKSEMAYSDILQDVYLLLAFGDPSKSPSGYLTKQSRREMVADRLNSAILASQGRPMRSMLERFICQGENVLAHLLRMRNGPAALVSVQEML